jgi:hypothetical protein
MPTELLIGEALILFGFACVALATWVSDRT